MTFFTGDIHGSPWGIKEFCEKMNLTGKDIVIILGDVAANYYGDQRDEMMKTVLNSLKATILCIHGNHEQRPETINGYELKEWNGGMVWVNPNTRICCLLVTVKSSR
ncbi:MAG: metallophosphoesterase family protein [Eubacteriales bacterium]|nr:metallophosphoesterase family protein [Eubacteriales bacterium]